MCEEGGGSCLVQMVRREGGRQGGMHRQDDRPLSGRASHKGPQAGGGSMRWDGKDLNIFLPPCMVVWQAEFADRPLRKRGSHKGRTGGRGMGWWCSRS